MNTYIFHFAALSLTAMTMLLGGCDPLGSKKAEQERIRRQEQEDERAREEKSAYAAGLVKLADAKIRSAESDRKSAEAALAEAKADFEILARSKARVSAERTAKGDPLKVETALLHLMRDADVGRLAMKYLSGDFALVASEFVERIRSARAEEARYQNEIKRADDIYSASIAKSSQWTASSAEQREAEIRRLNAEISSLESRRRSALDDFANHGKHRLAGGGNLERERREAKQALSARLNDIDGQILVKRGQIDSLRNPDANRDIESRAADRELSVQYRANDVRRMALMDVEQHYRPRQSVVDVVSEYSAKTIGALDAKLAGSLENAARMSSEAKERAARISELRLAIPISTMAELHSIRTKLDK